MLDHFSIMCKIDTRQTYFFMTYIIPDIQLCPVADRKYPYIFSFMNSAVINVPKLRTLQLWIPLSKFITNRKNSFFCSCFFFVSPGTPDTTIKFEFFDCV